MKVARLGSVTSPKNVLTYLGWGRSLLSPRERLLPGLGARLGAHPRLASAILVGLRRLPTARLRASVYRHVSRPLVRRMNARLEVPVSGGSRMIVDTSDVIGRSLAVSGTWETHVTPVLARLLTPGDVCVDVGAHVGYFTLLASKLVGAEGSVYAIEPAPATYAALQENLELNSVTNVIALNVAAGAEDGRATLYDPFPGNTGEATMRYVPALWTAREQALASGVEVPVRRVASVVPDAQVTQVRLVKIDVEGYELEVLRGLESWFRAGGGPALIVELHPALWAEGDERRFADLCRRYSLEPIALVDEDRLDCATADPIGRASAGGRQDLLLVPKRSIVSPLRR